MTLKKYYYARARKAMEDEQIVFTPADFGEDESWADDLLDATEQFAAASQDFADCTKKLLEDCDPSLWTGGMSIE